MGMMVLWFEKMGVLGNRDVGMGGRGFWRGWGGDVDLDDWLGKFCLLGLTCVVFWGILE